MHSVQLITPIINYLRENQQNTQEPRAYRAPGTTTVVHRIITGMWMMEVTSGDHLVQPPGDIMQGGSATPGYPGLGPVRFCTFPQMES